MYIYDLEFINSCEAELDQKDFVVIGGAAAFTKVDIARNDNEVFSSVSAFGMGDYSNSVAATGVKLIAPKNYQDRSSYSATYATGYGIAYGVDRYSTVASDRSVSTTTF